MRCSVNTGQSIPPVISQDTLEINTFLYFHYFKPCATGDLKVLVYLHDYSDDYITYIGRPVER